MPTDWQEHATTWQWGFKSSLLYHYQSYHHLLTSSFCRACLSADLSGPLVWSGVFYLELAIVAA